jgi:hypothetical protein
MKKITRVFLSLALIIGLSSCGINQAWILNQNQNTTQVQLSRNNFRVVSQVRGSSEVEYVLFFGGMKKRQQYNAAYTDMLEKAALSTGARALTNILTEEHVGGVPPLYYKRTITVTATVIEFTQ